MLINIFKILQTQTKELIYKHIYINFFLEVTMFILRSQMVNMNCKCISSVCMVISGVVVVFFVFVFLGGCCFLGFFFVVVFFCRFLFVCWGVCVCVVFVCFFVGFCYI